MRKEKDKKEKRTIRAHYVICAATETTMIAAFVAVNAYDKGQDMTAWILFQHALSLLLLLSIGILAIPACIRASLFICRWIDRDAVSTALQMAGLKISEKIRAKNFRLIYPRLQDFLFYVLAKNNENLALPLGTDAGSLSPFGAHYVMRGGHLFYRFQLIMPDAPDWSCDVLRKLMQSYVVSELQNYGIIGLNSIFVDKDFRAWYSVYVDRLFMDETNRCLTIDVAYIASNSGGQYLQKALRRDNASPVQEREAFDDELG